MILFNKLADELILSAKKNAIVALETRLLELGRTINHVSPDMVDQLITDTIKNCGFFNTSYSVHIQQLVGLDDNGHLSLNI